HRGRQRGRAPRDGCRSSKGTAMHEHEADLLRAGRQLAAWAGWLCYHTHESRRSPAGFVDVVLARPQDAVIFAELKSTRGRIRPEQQQWLQTLLEAQGVPEAYLWRPEDWGAIEARLLRRRRPW